MEAVGNVVPSSVATVTAVAVFLLKGPVSFRLCWSLAHTLSLRQRQFFAKCYKLFLISEMPCESPTEPELLQASSCKHH